MSDKVHLPLDSKILLANMWLEQHRPPQPDTTAGDDDSGKDGDLPPPGKKPEQDEPER